MPGDDPEQEPRWSHHAHYDAGFVALGNDRPDLALAHFVAATYRLLETRSGR